MGLSSFIESRATADENKLFRLGYKQELKRSLSYFHNFAVAFAFLSPITGLTGTYAMLYSYGGPVTIVYSWMLVFAFNILVGLVLAEICSAYPTCGGVYFWTFQLGDDNNRKIAAWVAGWFNLLGNVAALAGAAYTAAILIADFVLLATGTYSGGGYVCSQELLLAIYAVLLVLCGVMNSYGARFLSVVGNMCVWWHVVAGSLFIILLPAIAPKHQSAEWVFTKFIPDPATGVDNSGLLFLLGILGSQWAMVGYDCPAHMVEETKGADYSGPISMIVNICCSFVIGLAFLLSITFSIADPSTILDGNTSANPLMQISWEAFKGRYGSGTGGLILMGIPLVCILFCTNACVTCTSRMLFAFSRDDALPFSSLWKKVHPTYGAPVNAVWCCVLLSFIAFLPSLGSTVAFPAVTSIGVIGLYISYGIPIGLRIFVRGNDFQTGPFNLGRWSKPIGIVAFVYVIFGCILFVCPYVYPVTAKNLNYAPVAVGAVLVFSLGRYFIDARRWFVGPPLHRMQPDFEDKVQKTVE